MFLLHTVRAFCRKTRGYIQLRRHAQLSDGHEYLWQTTNKFSFLKATTAATGFAAIWDNFPGGGNPKIADAKIASLHLVQSHISLLRMSRPARCGFAGKKINQKLFPRSQLKISRKSQTLPININSSRTIFPHRLHAESYNQRENRISNRKRLSFPPPSFLPRIPLLLGRNLQGSVRVNPSKDDIVVDDSSTATTAREGRELLAASR